MSRYSDGRSDERRIAAELTHAERHRLLASDRRRSVLDALEGRAAPVELTTLAETVVSRETGGSDVDDERVERVAVSLHHVHLPKLDDVGVVQYDPDTRRVEPVGPVPDAPAC